MKPPTSSWAIDALIEDEKQNGKQKKEKKKQGVGPQPNYSGCFLRPACIIWLAYSEKTLPSGGTAFKVEKRMVIDQ